MLKRGGVIFALILPFLFISEKAGSAYSFPPMQVESIESSGLSVEQQILILDLDILLLKAELAKKNSQPHRVRNYLVALKDNQQLLSSRSDFLQRYLALKQYIESLPEGAISQTFLTEADQFFYDETNPVAILPLTGPYASAGEAILEGVLEIEGLENLQVFDSHIYDTTFELWELIRLYEPTLIIGPLEPKKVAELYELDTNVPTIAFNQLPQESLKPRFKTFSPDSNSQIAYLIEAMMTNQYQRIGVLYDKSPKSKRLLSQFESSWAELKAQAMMISESTEFIQSVQIEPKQVIGNVDQAMAELLNINRAYERQNWLSKTLGHQVSGMDRSRQDFDVIVSFLPSETAGQVTPLLNYYKLNGVIHIWLPSHLPSAEKLSSNLPFWQPTLAILPDYFASKVSAVSKQHQKDKPSSNGHFSDPRNNVGIFYALGNLSVEVAKKMATQDDKEFSSVLGRMQLQQGQMVIKPSAYWLDNGVIQKTD